MKVSYRGHNSHFKDEEAEVQGEVAGLASQCWSWARASKPSRSGWLRFQVQQRHCDTAGRAANHATSHAASKAWFPSVLSKGSLMLAFDGAAMRCQWPFPHQGHWWSVALQHCCPFPQKFKVLENFWAFLSGMGAMNQWVTSNVCLHAYTHACIHRPVSWQCNMRDILPYGTMRSLSIFTLQICGFKHVYL